MNATPTPAMMAARRQPQPPRPVRHRRRPRREPVSAQDRWMAGRLADAVRNGMSRDVPLTREQAAARQFARMRVS